jgi:hypothetical protein
MTYHITPEDLQIIKRGQSAAKKIGRLTGTPFETWVDVGFGAQRRQIVAERMAGTNRPFGAAYKDAFRQLVHRYPFGDMDENPTERAAAITMIENLPAITTWRNGLSESERRKINHPVAVLRRWKADQKAAHDTGEERGPTLRDQLKALKHEIARVRQEGTESLFAMTDTPDDKARSLVDRLTDELSLGETVEVLQYALARATQLALGQRAGADTGEHRDSVEGEQVPAEGGE